MPICASQNDFGKALVVAQVTLSLLLLVGAGLFVQTLRNLKNIDARSQRDGVVTMRVNPSVTIYQGARLANLWQEILLRVEKPPGMRSGAKSSATTRNT